MAGIALALKVVFFFVGTFLHELAHYLSAMLLGKAEGFSVLPRREGDHFVFGQVKSRTRYRILSAFVASAPLVWWVALLMGMSHLRLLRISGGMPAIDFPLVQKRIQSFSPRDLIAVWLILQILWAGRLSVSDLKNILRGLFSVSGMVFLLLVAAVFYLSMKYL